MLLARAAAREKEMAIRTSLGAGRWLLVRQLLIESLMLAFGGAVLGCVFAYAGIKGVKGLMPQGLFPTEADHSFESAGSRSSALAWRCSRRLSSGSCPLSSP